MIELRPTAGRVTLYPGHPAASQLAKTTISFEAWLAAYRKKLQE
jgi:hypothetical protein